MTYAVKPLPVKTKNGLHTTTERCGNTEFCGGRLALDSSLADDFGHNEPRCISCNKTFKQGKARMKVIRQFRQQQIQKQAEADAKQRKQEEIIRMMKEEGMTVAEDIQNKKQEALPRWKEISPQLEAIKSDLKTIGLKPTIAKYHLSTSTIHAYREAGLLPFTGRGHRPRHVLKSTERKSVKTEKQNGSEAAPTTSPASSGRIIKKVEVETPITITGTFIPTGSPRDLPPLPPFSRWWWPSVQREWLRTFRELMGRKS